MLKKRTLLLISFLFSCFHLCSTALGDVLVKPRLYEIPENCNFMSLESGNNSRNQCSPKLINDRPKKFEGILINGPKEVICQKKDLNSNSPVGPIGQTSGPLRLMVTGFIQTKYMYLNLKGEFGDSVLLVAVDQKTAKTYSGKMSQGDIRWDPAPPMSPEEKKEFDEYNESKKDMLTEDRFTLDLVHDLELPITSATYNVYATLGELKSNILTIKTIIK